MTNRTTQSPTVLLVEDDPGAVRLFEEAMRIVRFDAVFHAVGTGASALRFIHKVDEYRDVATPDLVFLDLNLPGMSGFEILERLKCEERTRSIPVVVLSSSAAQTDVSRAYELYGNSYVTKPRELGDFLEMLESVGKFWLEIARLP